MGQFSFWTEAYRLLEERKSGFWIVQLNVAIRQICKSLSMIRIVYEFGLQLFGGLVKLQLCPKQVAQAEMHIRHFRSSLHRRAELFDGGRPVFHLIQCLPG